MVSARRALEQGFTTIRDVGANTEVVVALKKAVNAGLIPGPRMWVAGAPISPTGGHGDSANGLDPELSHPGWTDNIVDHHRARYLCTAGAAKARTAEAAGDR